MSVRPSRVAALAAVAGMALAVPAAAATERPIYVRPGAPGEPTQRISPQDLAPSPTYVYSQAEVEFVQHMMVHHAQALTMSSFAPDRAESGRVLTLASRIAVTQKGEIDQMRRWLRLRDEEIPVLDYEVHDDHNGDMHDGDMHDGDMDDEHDHSGMPGMLTEEQLAELEAADGQEFDVLFLEFMIFHHRGAITMVRELEAAQPHLEPNIAVLAQSIVEDQRAEIGYMESLLRDLQG
jgi:uncharacterized protein (DUF305 family)